MMHSNLSDTTSDAMARCLELMERHCPRLMVAGAGALHRELPQCARRLTPKTRRRIIELRAEGFSQLEVAKRVGCHQRSVLREERRHKLSTLNHPTP